jgi:hypothetical protein
MEPLEEFWKRSRLRPREDSTEVLDVGGDLLWTEYEGLSFVPRSWKQSLVGLTQVELQTSELLV